MIEKRKSTQNQSINFYQLLGAPLVAIIQAETQAAQATAEFIERVGFDKKPEKGGTGEFGDLRLIHFKYQKTGFDGIIQTYEVSVPLLSLVPIPALQIKNAELDFFVKITDMQSTEMAGSMADEATNKGNFLSNARLEFKASMGRMSGTQSTQHSSEMQMRVKVNVEQADIPAGLSHLFRIMDDSISNSPVNNAEPKPEE